ncbi:hypothetical protein PVAP13_8KG108600 [Panicum virgatum]|uniref:Uncharacterized protein n=1 Tax=Panicum virgatum TaxID=38727 RepID=A0A8T0PSL6_PANVG|nr:hypothetical protein PVAP13_8KG108600 [Panicum virgatum]
MINPDPSTYSVPTRSEDRKSVAIATAGMTLGVPQVFSTTASSRHGDFIDAFIKQSRDHQWNLLMTSMGPTRMREYFKEKMNTATLERHPYVVFLVKVGILFQITRKERN